jgi:hypothetical protein
LRPRDPSWTATPTASWRDLLFPRSEIDGIAAEEAARRVARFVGAHPEYRKAWYGRGRRTSLALQNG